MKTSSSSSSSLIPGQLCRLVGAGTDKTYNFIELWPLPLRYEDRPKQYPSETMVMYLRPCSLDDYPDCPVGILPLLAVVLHETRMYIVYARYVVGLK